MSSRYQRRLQLERCSISAAHPERSAPPGCVSTSSAVIYGLFPDRLREGIVTYLVEMLLLRSEEGPGKNLHSRTCEDPGLASSCWRRRNLLHAAPGPAGSRREGKSDHLVEGDSVRNAASLALIIHPLDFGFPVRSIFNGKVVPGVFSVPPAPRHLSSALDFSLTELGSDSRI